MPIYKWYGVDIVGENRTGTLYADSISQLDELLFSRQVALLRAKTVPKFFMRAPSMRTQIRFFEQCAAMLEAGISLPIVLQNLAGAPEQELIMQIIVRGLSDQVTTGVSLYNACAKYPQLFDVVSLAMIKAGEQYRALPGAMRSLSRRLQLHHEFASKLRAALVVPVITGAFFLGACGIIVGVILPSFAHMFSGSHATLPLVTRILLRMSSSISINTVLMMIAGICFLLATLFVVTSKETMALCKDQLLGRLPYVGPIIRLRYQLHFFDTLTLLLQQSVLLVPALAIAIQTVHNRPLRAELDALRADVNQGLPLHAALTLHVQALDPALVSMIATGEQVADLSKMIALVCNDLRSSIFERLSFITKVIQPALLLILGLLVALLIFAVYLPLISIPAMF